MACIIGIFYGINYAFNNYDTMLSKFFYVFGIIAFAFFLIWIILLLVYGKNWIIGSGKDILVGSDLISAINQTLDELPKPSRPTLSKLLGHLVYRFTRIGILGLFIASIPIILLWQQNRKMDIQTGLMNVQNDKIEIQNKKINIQNSLIEADRRSSLVFLMSNVLDKVDDEIREQRKELAGKSIEINDNTKYSLSKPLRNRIIALSKTLKPYKLLDGDTLSPKKTSLERGQLFTALMDINLDSITQNSIVEKGDFSYADIGAIDLQGAKLRRANLSHVNLKGANLSNANLTSANLTNAYLGKVKLDNVNFFNANLSKVKLFDTKLTNSNLNSTNLTGAFISEVDFAGAKLLYTNFERSGLYDVSFYKAELLGTLFRGSVIEFTSFPESSMPNAITREKYIANNQKKLNSMTIGDLGAFYESDRNWGANLSETEWVGMGQPDINFSLVLVHGARLDGFDFQRAKYRLKDLLYVQTLYDSKNLDPKIKAELEKEKPCLFTKEGCNL